MIWGAVVGTIFVVLWRKGYLLQLTNYVQQTREELRKCTWPTWDELKGSTVVISHFHPVAGRVRRAGGSGVLPSLFMFFKL